jgi:hypothetical protein
MPGRRVLLAVTDGHDGGSSITWAQAQHYAASQGVAVFGIRDASTGTNALSPGFSGRRGTPALMGSLPDEDPFRGLCESNGGVVLATTRFELHRSLMQFVTYLRDRYIVEFPRPDDSQPGLHQIEVTVAKTRYVVRSTGVSVSMPDPDVANDPNTVPVSKSPATIGPRKTPTPKQ